MLRLQDWLCQRPAEASAAGLTAALIMQWSLRHKTEDLTDNLVLGLHGFLDYGQLGSAVELLRAALS